jgi:nitrate/nitrite transport system permease protein
VPLAARSAIVSLLIAAIAIFAWHVATLPKAGPAQAMDPEYAKLMGLDKPKADGLPTPAELGSTAWKQLSHPFYDRGSNDKGIGIQLAYSLGRVGLGFFLAALVAIPLGFAVGLSPLLHRALNPFIQVLKPISPLAWMPLALYTIKDSAVSSIFVIFICSLWPMLINTAHGVASVRRDWLNVAKTLEAGTVRTCLQVILPAAAPVILTGMRISMGIAWLVIVAAEMLTGGVGIGFWVWDEWNNLNVEHIIIAIFTVGIVGLLLEQALMLLARRFEYR